MTERPSLALTIGTALGILFLHVPLGFIVLYAFSTEEKSYQFPRPATRRGGSRWPGSGRTSGTR